MGKRKEIRVVQLASFSGNIGDYANHLSFRKWFEKVIDKTVLWTEVEIRDFFRDKKFDEPFFKSINNYDLFIIGGGNFLELWVEKSQTGTTIDFPSNVFSLINIPIYFNALGVDDGQGICDSAKQHFSDFINKILENENCLFSVRNDGSFDCISRFPDIKLISKVYKTPDAGFFYFDHFNYDNEEKPDKSLLKITINLACDLKDIRFPSSSYDNFVKIFPKILLDSLNIRSLNYEITFVPHIYSDLIIISDVLKNVPEEVRRRNIVVASLGFGERYAQRSIRHYAESRLNIGMRFHSNILSYSAGVNTIGLSSYPQISKLYAEINLPNEFIDLRSASWESDLHVLLNHKLGVGSKHAEVTNKVKNLVFSQRDSFENILLEWLEKVLGI
jgi:polysaccharide pyruvyl transferase WcaK-like protein